MKEKTTTFFKDKNGHVVLWQAPNLLLWGWIVLKVIMFVLASSKLRTGLDQMSNVLLFTWAYYEADQGVSLFRKTLGMAVMFVVVLGFFV